MKIDNKMMITVSVSIQAPIEKVWEHWNEPKYITQWYNASDDWHAPFAENDLKVGGKFKTGLPVNSKATIDRLLWKNECKK